ncbi:hypothetical protein ACFCZY_38580 [Streptomyces sp. NPDC056237]|uniref:hypothetical protein n=1 Tax=Streptomyces sp. NPDC056237 TaxID=3345758 RepID=UPI0035DF112D
MTTPAPQVLDASGSVTLDASGHGVVQLAPESFRTWLVTTNNVATTQDPTQTPVPQVRVFLGGVGGQRVAQSWMGNQSTATGSTLVQPSQPLVIEWVNGVPGSVATAWLYGTMTMR